MTRHIRALAWWHLVFNGLCLLAGVALCVALIAEGGGDWKANQALMFVGWFFLGLSIFYFVPGFLGGWGLFKQRGWARVLIIIESVLYLPLFPIGTALGGYGLWVLLKPEAGLEFGRKAMGPPISHSWIPAALRSQESPAARRNGLLFAMALVGSGFIVMIGTGYRLSGDPGSPISPTVYYAAIAILGGAIVITVREIKAGHWPVRSQRVVEGQAGGPQLHYSRRPVDEDRQRVAYAQDQTTLATCPHLQPIERAMLDQGILIGLVTGLQVRAYCVIDPAGLERQFRLTGDVNYSEPSGYDRGPDDPPASLIACDACHSVIEVVHPLAAVPETPKFPVPA